MIESLEKEVETAIAAVRAATAVCRSVQAKSPEALAKNDRSPVTVADFASQALVCKTLAEAFPLDPIIAEEGADDLRKPAGESFLKQIQNELRHTGIDANNDDICQWIDRGNTPLAVREVPRFWTLDPIDGTKGFLRGEQYAVALALIVEGSIEVAAMACPNLPVAEGADSPIGTILYAVRGKGSFCIPVASGGVDPRRPNHVSRTEDTKNARYAESVESGHSAQDHAAIVAKKLGIHKQPLRMDSQAKYAVVGRGDADIYLRLPTRPDYREKIWDHAAGALVVEEAGGKVTDMYGNPLEFCHGREFANSCGVIVTNGALHEQVLQALSGF